MPPYQSIFLIPTQSKAWHESKADDEEDQEEIKSKKRLLIALKRFDARCQDLASEIAAATPPSNRQKSASLNSSYNFEDLESSDASVVSSPYFLDSGISTPAEPVDSRPPKPKRVGPQSRYAYYSSDEEDVEDSEEEEYDAAADNDDAISTFTTGLSEAESEIPAPLPDRMRLNEQGYPLLQMLAPEATRRRGLLGAVRQRAAATTALGEQQWQPIGQEQLDESIISIARDIERLDIRPMTPLETGAAERQPGASRATLREKDLNEQYFVDLERERKESVRQQTEINRKNLLDRLRVNSESAQQQYGTYLQQRQREEQALLDKFRREQADVKQQLTSQQQKSEQEALQRMNNLTALVKQHEDNIRRLREEERKRKEAEEQKRQEEERKRKEAEEAQRKKQEELRKQQQEEEERKKREEQEARAKAAAAAAAASNAAKAQAQAQAAQAASAASSFAAAPSAGAAVGGADSSFTIVSPYALQENVALVTKLQQAKNSYEKFAQNPVVSGAMKNTRKTVNKYLNAVSTNRADVLKKVQLLQACLDESKQYEVIHTYCMDILAEKLVTKAVSQISNEKDRASSFAYAMIAVALSEKTPALMDYFLAHFNVMCPYIVPMYLMKKPGQSDKDYKIALGYEDDGEEKRESYVLRMAGLVSLYAAIIQFNQFDIKNTTHGAERGWTWLARILNMPPIVITCDILESFLSIAVFELNRRFGSQFKKMLVFLRDDFMKRMPEETDKGAMFRLKEIIDKTVLNGSPPEPPGRNLEAAAKVDVGEPDDYRDSYY